MLVHSRIKIEIRSKITQPLCFISLGKTWTILDTDSPQQLILRAGFLFIVFHKLSNSKVFSSCDKIYFFSRNPAYTFRCITTYLAQLSDRRVWGWRQPVFFSPRHPEWKTQPNNHLADISLVFIYWVIICVYLHCALVYVPSYIVFRAFRAATIPRVPHPFPLVQFLYSPRYTSISQSSQVIYCTHLYILIIILTRGVVLWPIYK